MHHEGYAGVRTISTSGLYYTACIHTAIQSMHAHCSRKMSSTYFHELRIQVSSGLDQLRQDWDAWSAAYRIFDIG